MDPNAVPAPLGARAPKLVKYAIETVELDGRLDDGTTFTYWTFDKQGARPDAAREGRRHRRVGADQRKDSKAMHTIDLHAVTGGFGGGEHTQVAPGQTKTITFKALNPGLYVYHCATPSVAHHISAGMYGLILVEPKAACPRWTSEFYVMQGDFYTSHAFGTKGHHEFNPDKAADELPPTTPSTARSARSARSTRWRQGGRDGAHLLRRRRPEQGLLLPRDRRDLRQGVQRGLHQHHEGERADHAGARRRRHHRRIQVQYPGKYLLVDHSLLAPARDWRVRWK